MSGTKKPHQIIFVNGPPRSGKDTTVDFAIKEFINIRHAKFASVLKNTIKEFGGISDALYKDLETPGSQGLKDQPLFMGKSYREMLIWFSEQCAKPEFGQDVFGQLLAKRLRAPTSTYATMISDCGFVAEVGAVVKVFGAQNCHMFQLFRDGCTFVGDSRSYLAEEDLLKLGTWDKINNDFELDMFKRQILRRVNKILGFDRRFD